MAGITEASATRRPVTPRTLKSSSTTLLSLLSTLSTIPVAVGDVAVDDDVDDDDEVEVVAMAQVPHPWKYVLTSRVAYSSNHAKVDA